MRVAQTPRLPPVVRGMRIGLFGGSFNPPHDGHVLVAETAMKRLKLDRVWWLVTPGNPLKETRDLPPLAARMAACRALAPDPRMVITGIEAALGTVFTQQTIAYLRRRHPGVHFVWIMGADNLIGFHRWQRWRAIARAVPMAVVDRPDATLRATASPAGRWLARYRQPERRAGLLPLLPPPAWIFLYGTRSASSSTMLRKGRNAAKPSGIRG
jgi:nicotinate-nucleotide adenylyltransferase